MNRFLSAAITLAFFPSIALAQASGAEQCTAVYQNAVKDLNFNTTETTEQSFYFNLYCNESGDLSEVSTSASASFPIKGIPVSLSGDGDWSRTEVEDFCQIGAENQLYDTSTVSFASIIARDALSSFNECLALASESLVVSHTISPPFGVLISGTLTNTVTNIALDGLLFEEDKVICTSTSFSEDGSADVIDGNQSFDLNNQNFSIACNRLPVSTGDGGTYYPETSITLSTNASDYVVRLRDETNLGFALASEAKAVYDAMENRLDLAGTEAEALNATISRLTNSLSGLSLRRFYHGNDPQNVGHDFHSNCSASTDPGNPANFNMSALQLACPTGQAIRDAVMGMSVPGGPCGHTVVVVACTP